MAVMVEAMTALKGNWKLTNSQYDFVKRLLSLYRQRNGRKFDKRLRGWLFFNQKRRLHAAEFKAYLQLFDYCADERELTCGRSCPDYQTCIEVYGIISNRSDYSPIKTGDSNSYDSESPVLHGPAAELFRFLNRVL